MPGGFAISFGQANLNDQGTNAAASLGTTLTASGSTNTKGSYAQLVASTPYDASGFWLLLSGASSLTAGYLVDLAIGAAASEIVLVPNVPFNIQSAANSGTLAIFVPCAIPAGTRISARVQSSTGSTTVTAAVVLLDGSFDEDSSLAAPQNYGALTASSVGTSIDPGASANMKGSWVQIAASTTYDIGALQLICDTQKNVTTIAQTWLIDIGIGAGGSEKVIAPNISLSCNAGPMLTNPAPPLIRCQIPSGTRLAIRAQGTNGTSATRKFGATLLGYQQ
jgi:hypothetical protein